MKEYHGTYLAWGPPGTGKTTYLSKQVREIVEQSPPSGSSRCPVLVCSLTKTAAAEVAGKNLPVPRTAVGTLHAMAYRTIGSPEIAETKLDDWNAYKIQYRITPSGSTGDVNEAGWDQQPGKRPGDTLLAELNLLRAKMTPRNLWPMRVQNFARHWDDWKAINHLVDFSDMIDIALRDYPNRPPGNPSVVIADEAQDHSALEYGLLRAWGKAAGALIATGDPWQALYCWRGAHPELFQDPSVPDDHRRVLSQSYRIPRAVHIQAMKWVRGLSDWSDISYKPRDADGAVIQSQATWRAPELAIDLAEKYLANDQSVMFQVSCSYMIAPIIAVLRQRGIPFSNPWRTKHGGWNPLRQSGEGTTSMSRRLLDFLVADPGTYGQDARRWTYGELDSWATVLKSAGTLVRGAKIALTQASEDYSGELVSDAAMDQWFDADAWGELRGALQARDPELRDEQVGTVTLRSLIKWWVGRLLKARCGSIDYLTSILVKRGPDTLNTRPQCYVGTIHSFKGGEADACFLFPDLSPSGWTEWNTAGSRRDGVRRLMYVGMTRAKSDLILCGQSGTAAVDWR